MSTTWSALLNFLNQPAVAIRVCERREAAVIGALGMKAVRFELRALEPASARCVTCAVWSSIGALSWMNARH
jgi:hypothetical protein